MSGVGDLVAHLVADTTKWKSGLDKAKTDISSFAASATSALTGLAGVFGGVFGAGMSLAAIEGDIKATQKFEAVLAATGGTAGITSDEMNKLASNLQRVTKFEDDATVGAAAIMATFRNIRGDNFTKAISLAQDMATVLNIDLDFAVKKLGKSMKDLSPEDVGKKLDDMVRQYGGAAKKAVTATEQIGLAIGNISEEIGKVLLPFVTTFAAVVIPFTYEWGHQIAIVALAVGGLITVLSAVAVAQKGIAIGQALIMSLGGPAGWAALAAGAVAFGIAVVGIETAMAGVVTQTQSVTAEVRKMNDEFQRMLPGPGWKGMLPELEERMNAPSQDVEFDPQATKEFENEIDKIADEIAVLSGAATQAEIDLENLTESGLSPENAEALIRARELLASLKTPEEKAAEEEAKDKKDKQDNAIRQTPGALAKGSAEAASAIFTAMRQNDIPKKQLAAEEENVDQNREMIGLLEDIKGSGMILVAGSVA